MIDDKVFYVGETVPLAFEIYPVSPRSSTLIVDISVSIYSDAGEIIRNDPVTVIDNQVKYLVPEKTTKSAGNYKAIFTVRSRLGETIAHSIPFTVIPRGIKSPAKNLLVENLHLESTEEEILRSISRDLKTIRSLGKLDEYKDSVYAVAQERTKKRIPR